MSRPTSPKRDDSSNYSGFEVPLANDAATAAQAEAQAEGTGGDGDNEGVDE